MKKEMIIDNDFKIKFGCQEHQVDAQVLISSLIHTTTVIQELNKYLNTGKKIEIKVNALKEGSFFIHIELKETTLEALKNLLTKENISFAGNLIAGFVALIQLRQLLKGKKPQEVIQNGSETKIINENNEVVNINTNIYNIYNSSPIINEALSKNFENLEDDPAIDTFEITDKNENPYAIIERTDFQALSLRTELSNENRNIKIVNSASLNIVRLSFDENLKWDFYYNGNKISAKITDPNFNTSIDKGESFAKGDILEVELQINQLFDESVNTYINKSYQINKISNHIKRSEQQKMEFLTE